MVNINVIKQRLSQLDESIKRIEKYNHLTFDQYIKNDIAQDVTEYNLFIAINMISDMATHIVVDNNLGNPKTLGESFDILWKKNYINKKEAKKYKKMVGLRNILAHEYLDINKRIIYDSIKNKTEDLREFILFISENFI